MQHISLAAEPIFHIGPLAVTNSMVGGLLTSIVLLFIAFTAIKKVRLQPAAGVPGGFEAVIEVILAQIEQVMGTRERALYYFPLLATLFLFILAGNWLALLPGFGIPTIATPEGEIPILRAVTADLNATIALALLSVIITQIFAIRQLGVVSHLKNYFSKNPIMNVVGVLEIVLELTRVISFSFRLFGNIFAGEVMLIVIASLIPILGPVPFWGFEIFVGFIQAFVFTTLTMVFIAVATTSHAEAH